MPLNVTGVPISDVREAHGEVVNLAEGKRAKLHIKVLTSATMAVEFPTWDAAERAALISNLRTALLDHYGEGQVGIELSMDMRRGEATWTRARD